MIGFSTNANVVSIEKGDDEDLDYAIDMAPLLQPGESIAEVAWTVGAGLAMHGEAIDGAKAVVWLSGGAQGGRYPVDAVITTTAARVFERSFDVRVVARRFG